MLQTYVHAVLLMLASVFYWVGCWDLLTAPMYDDRGFGKEDGTRAIVLPIYFLFGFALCALSDSLYALGGIPGSYLPTQWRTSKCKLLLRLLCGAVGAMMMWVAVFYFVAVFVGFESEGLFKYSGYTPSAKEAAPPKYLLKDLVCILYGMAMLVATGTFFGLGHVNATGANPPCVCLLEADPRHVQPTAQSPLSTHALAIARSLLSLSGQVALWLGTWDIMEYYYPTTVLREILYAFVGLGGLFATGTLLQHAGLEGKGRTTSGLGAQCAVALLSLLLHLMFFVGFWTLVDSHCGDHNSRLRNVLYVLLGIAGFATSPSTLANRFIPDEGSQKTAGSDTGLDLELDMRGSGASRRAQLGKPLLDQGVGARAEI